LYKKMTAG